MRAIGLGAALVPAIFLSAASPPARTVCDGAGCFVATATGHINQKISGKGWYSMKDGRLIIVLLAKESPRFTMVITRDSAGLPSSGQEIALERHSCDGDEEGAQSQSPEQFHLSIRGGSPLFPAWVAVPSAGSLQLSSGAAGTITGTFAVEACGIAIEGDSRMTVNLDGSFQAVKL